jgi:hypothetical protein
MKYTCECGDELTDCHLEFEEDEDYENAYHIIKDKYDREHASILHPNCSNISARKILEQCDTFIIVKYPNH